MFVPSFKSFVVASFYSSAGGSWYDAVRAFSFFRKSSYVKSALGFAPVSFVPVILKPLPISASGYD